MTDSPPDLPVHRPLPPAREISTLAQYAAIGLMLSGAVGTGISAISLFFNTVVGAMVVFSQLVTLSQVSGAEVGMVIAMSSVGLLFALSFILPLATSLATVYAGYSLNNGGNARVIRMAAVGSLVGCAFIVLGSIPGIVFAGCTSLMVLLSSPLLVILSVGAAVLAFVAVREGELLQHDAANELPETS